MMRIKLFGTGNTSDKGRRNILGTPAPRFRHSLSDEKTVYLQTGDKLWQDVPKNMRAELWISILQKKHNRQFSKSLNYDAYLRKEVSEDVVDMIEKDVGRTFPESKWFNSEEGKGSMKRVLRAYAAYDPEISYCQGMNFLTGLLLLYMPSESFAFDGLVFLMYDRKLREFYNSNMTLLQANLYQLGQLLPFGLLNHLESTGALPVLFAPSWLMTCFAATFPLQISSRVMDIVFCNSISGVMLKVALTILQQNAKEIMSLTEMESILNFIRNDIPNQRTSKLHEIVTEAAKVPWTPEQEAILNNRCIETVHDAILRVEEGVFSPRKPSLLYHITSLEAVTNDSEKMMSSCVSHQSMAVMSVDSPSPLLKKCNQFNDHISSDSPPQSRINVYRNLNRTSQLIPGTSYCPELSRIPEHLEKSDFHTEPSRDLPDIFRWAANKKIKKICIQEVEDERRGNSFCMINEKDGCMPATCPINLGKCSFLRQKVSKWHFPFSKRLFESGSHYTSSRSSSSLAAEIEVEQRRYSISERELSSGPRERGPFLKTGFLSSLRCQDNWTHRMGSAEEICRRAINRNLFDVVFQKAKQ